MSKWVLDRSDSGLLGKTQAHTKNLELCKQLPIRSRQATMALSVKEGFFDNLPDLDRAFETLCTKKQLAERLALSQSYINQLMSEEGLPFFQDRQGA